MDPGKSESSRSISCVVLRVASPSMHMRMKFSTQLRKYLFRASLYQRSEYPYCAGPSWASGHEVEDGTKWQPSCWELAAQSSTAHQPQEKLKKNTKKTKCPSRCCVSPALQAAWSLWEAVVCRPRGEARRPEPRRVHLDSSRGSRHAILVVPPAVMFSTFARASASTGLAHACHLKPSSFLPTLPDSLVLAGLPHVLDFCGVVFVCTSNCKINTPLFRHIGISRPVTTCSMFNSV